LLNISKTKDTTSVVFVIGNETKIQASKGQALNYTGDSPVMYLLDRPSKRYIVFSWRYSEDWKLDGKPPFANFGVTNAYNISDMKRNTLYYERFNIYLIGYLLSGIAFIFLIFYILMKKSAPELVYNLPFFREPHSYKQYHH